MKLNVEKCCQKKKKHNNASAWKLKSNYFSSASKRCLISRQTQRLCFIVVCFFNLWQAWSSGTGKQPFTINFWCPSRKRLSRVKREPSQMRILLMWAWSRPRLEGSFIHFLDSWGSNSSHSRADMIFASFLYQKHTSVLLCINYKCRWTPWKRVPIYSKMSEIFYFKICDHDLISP